jgi:uncharacterized membrane protein YfcA
MTRPARALLLAACVVCGALVGWVVERFATSAYGWLAVPVLVALAWLFVADPSACEPRVTDARRPPEPSPPDA